LRFILVRKQRNRRITVALFFGEHYQTEKLKRGPFKTLEKKDGPIFSELDGKLLNAAPYTRREKLAPIETCAFFVAVETFFPSFSLQQQWKASN